VRLVPLPLEPVIALTRCYERLSRRPRIRAEQWQRLAEDKAFPIEAAARDLDYAPRSFAAGIQAEAASLGLGSETSLGSTTAATEAPAPSVAATSIRRTNA